MQAERAGAEKHQDSDWLEAGEYLKVEMARQGFNAVSLAEKLKITSSAIYNVTGATRRPISAGLALKLSQELGGSVEFWLSERFPNHYVPPAAAAAAGSRPQGILTDRQLHELNGNDDDGFIISPFLRELLQGAATDLTMGLFITAGFDKIAKEARDCWFSFFQLDKDHRLFTDEQRQQFETLKTQNGVNYCSELELKPGESTIVVAAQYVRMGLRYVGLLGQTNEANLNGLIVYCGHQIDPGFNGPLLFRVKNDSGAKMTLKRDQLLASLTVVGLSEPVEKGYGKNRASQIRGVVDKLRAALAHGATIDSSGAGWQLTFQDQVFSGVSRDSAFSAFFTWLDGQLANHDDAVHAALSGVEINGDDIASLGGFLDADEESVKFAVEQAQANGKARLFGKAVANLTATAPAATEAYRKVCQELRSLVADLGGFDTAHGAGV